MPTGDGPHESGEHNVDPMTGRPIASEQVSYGGRAESPASATAGLPTAEPPPARPQSRSAPITLALTLLLVVGAAVTVVVVNSGGDRVAGKPVAGDAAVPSSTQPPTSAPTPSDTTLDEVLVDPVVPGWQGLRSPKDGAVYDVPKDWTIEDPDVITGYTDSNGKPTVLIHGVSKYKEGACGQPPPGEVPHSRATVGFVSVDSGEPDEIAPEIAEKWAKEAGADDSGTVPEVQLSPVEETTVGGGAIPAAVARATVVLAPADACTAPALLVTTAAFSLDDGSTAVFLMELDQQVADAVDDATVATMIQSLRPDG